MNLPGLLLAILVPQVMANEEGIQEQLKVLNTGIGASLNILFIFQNNTVYEKLLLENEELPKVVVSGSTRYEMRHHFSSKVLSIVLMEERKFGELENIFKKTLYRWHKTDVFFVTTLRAQKAWDWALDLFNWCWSNGFYNVLMRDGDGRLLSFDPFPQLQVEVTTLEYYMKIRNKRSNFRGYNMRVSVCHNPPKTMVYTDKRTGQTVYSGWTLQSIRNFAKSRNATVTLKVLPYGNFSYSVCQNLLERGEVDLCSESGTVFEGRVNSRPIFLYFHYLTVPAPQPIQKFRYVLVPFESSLWLLIGLMVCYVTIALSFISRVQGQHWSFGKCLLQAISSLLFLALRLGSIKGATKHIVFYVLTVGGFLISSLYLALLAGLLTTNVFEPEIKSIADLRARNISVMVNMDEIETHKTYGGLEPILNQIVVRDQKDYREHRDRLDYHFAYIENYDISRFFLYQQSFLKRPRMKILYKPLYSVYTGIPMRNYWPLEEWAHKHYLRVFEGGLYYQAVQTIRYEAIRMGHLQFFQTESYDAEALSVEFFELPAILLGVGYILAAVSFIVEKLLCAAFTNSNINNKSICC